MTGVGNIIYAYAIRFQSSIEIIVINVIKDYIIDDDGNGNGLSTVHKFLFNLIHWNMKVSMIAHWHQFIQIIIFFLSLQ